MGKIARKHQAKIDQIGHLITRIDKGIERRENMITLMRISRAALVEQRAAIIEKANG